MSGWEFRERQRADPRLSSLPVVVTSASGLAQETPSDRTDDCFGFSSCFALSSVSPSIVN